MRLGTPFISRPFQARGGSQEAESEVRALLNLLRENEADARIRATLFRQILQDACANLKILDPWLGSKELIEFVVAEIAKLRSRGCPG